MSNTHTGHRDRMKQRFINGDVENMYDHEILEMLLYYAIRQGDTNPIAHNLLEDCGGLVRVLETDFDFLKKVDGIGDSCAFLLKLVNEISRRKQEQTLVSEKPVIKCIQDAIDYCKSLYIGARKEEFHIICLNHRGHIIHDGIVGTGTVSYVSIALRTVVEHVLKHEAHAVILSHNHPGGNAHPSNDDFIMTGLIMDALAPLHIEVADHMIVGDDGYYSFAREGLINNIQTRRLYKDVTHLFDIDRIDNERPAQDSFARIIIENYNKKN